MIFFYFNQFAVCEKVRSVNSVLAMCIVANFILIILHWHGLVNSGKAMFFTFNGLVFVLSLMVFISALRHDYFKD